MKVVVFESLRADTPKFIVMSFWKEAKVSYLSVLDISEAEFKIFLNSLTREDIMEWLIWNDPNGIYSDEQSLKELGNIMTKEESLEIMLRHVEENRITN
jgi:hypothetical protein